jgi:hypothetical protein
MESSARRVALITRGSRGPITRPRTHRIPGAAFRPVAGPSWG